MFDLISRHADHRIDRLGNDNASEDLTDHLPDGECGACEEHAALSSRAAAS